MDTALLFSISPLSIDPFSQISTLRQSLKGNNPESILKKCSQPYTLNKFPNCSTVPIPLFLGKICVCLFRFGSCFAFSPSIPALQIQTQALKWQVIFLAVNIVQDSAPSLFLLNKLNLSLRICLQRTNKFQTIYVMFRRCVQEGTSFQDKHPPLLSSSQAQGSPEFISLVINTNTIKGWDWEKPQYCQPQTLKKHRSGFQSQETGSKIMRLWVGRGENIYFFLS